MKNKDPIIKNNNKKNELIYFGPGQAESIHGL